MNMLDQILHLKNVLSKKDCDFFINQFEKRKISAYKESSLTSITKKIERFDFKVVELQSISVGHDIAVKTINFGLQAWIKHLESLNSFNTVLLQKLLIYPHKIRILKYPKDSFILPHTDFAIFENASVTINLNDDYEGGQFCFFNQKHCIKLGIGDVLIFPANPFWLHEVTPILSGNRYAINSFITSQPSEIHQMYNFDYFANQTNTKPFFTYV